MREIIFRGKSLLHKQWYYGSLLDPDFEKKGYCLITQLYSDANARPISEPIKFLPFVVKAETVGEYTGLTDTNAKHIYEGDVVESRASENPEDWKRWLVSWQDGAFWFSTEPKKKRKHTYCLEDTLCEDNIAFYGLVVVGNIHDNPELMKEGAHGTNGM
ncbi:MAG: hypothetical protein J6B91_09270 [Prevotella sp.]|nr:hypothetical protein [Prevotella sp.]